MPDKRTITIKWIVLGLSIAVVMAFALWAAFVERRQERAKIEEPESEDIGSPFERKDTEAMGVSQLKAYIKECERERDFYECERAYQRAIQLTKDEESLFKDLIDFKFGLAELYLNSLWEYGQFGETKKVPPALKLAIGIYDEIIASYPDSDLAAEAQFRKGEVFHNEFSGYWNRLHRDDAIREFQKVIQLYPETDQAKRAKERLVALQVEK